jgi:hypothetical protein
MKSRLAGRRNLPTDSSDEASISCALNSCYCKQSLSTQDIEEFIDRILLPLVRPD